MARVLLIQASDLKEWTPVGGNVDKDKFLSFIEFKQSSDLREYLGTELLNSIYTKVQGGTLTGAYLTLVQSYIKPYLANATANDFIKVYGVQAGNAGPTTASPENATTAAGMALAKICRDRADHYGKILIEYLEANQGSFSEYKTSDTRTDSNFNGWQFDYDDSNC